MEAFTAVLGAISIFFFIQSVAARRFRRDSALAAAGLLDRPRPLTLPGRLRRSAGALILRLGKLLPAGDEEKAAALIAGCGFGFSPTYLQGLRLGCAILGLAVALPLGKALLILGPPFSALGYQLPVFYLKRRRKGRLERVGLELPEMVDLMAVLCFSGESLFQSLSHAVQACAHLSCQGELRKVVERVSFGQGIQEALLAVREHASPELRRFARVLLRGEEFGAPIAETLEQLASEFKSGRREKERVRAARGSVLILFPLVFMILPSFLLLTVGGMLLGYGR